MCSERSSQAQLINRAEWLRKYRMENTKTLKEKYREFRKEPIKENVVVFESLWGRSYSCNPAALYEYMLENHPEYEFVWFFNDTDTEIKGNAKKVERKSEEYYHYLATAKYFIYNANFPENFVKREGQIIVQTMHGTPFKTFGLDVKDELPSDKERMRVVKRSMIWDYLAAQGRFTKDMAWRWFRYDNAVLETGYPRTDALFRKDEKAASEVRSRLGIPEDKKVLLYAPTWRDMDRFDMMLDIEQLRAELADEYVLLIRPHYFVAGFYDVPEDGSFVFDGGRVDKVEDLFPITDILITDYSSVMFDFALTGKPMIFYTYDLKTYTVDTRGGYFDITTEAPGAIAMDNGEVIDAVKNVADHYAAYGARIDGFRDKYLTYEEGTSSAKMYEEVFVKDSRKRSSVRRHDLMTAIGRVIPRRFYNKARNKMIMRRLADDSRRD